MALNIVSFFMQIKLGIIIIIIIFSLATIVLRKSEKKMGEKCFSQIKVWQYGVDMAKDFQEGSY